MKGQLGLRQSATPKTQVHHAATHALQSDGRSSVIISVFSTGSGIGKTVTAINLAASLANYGHSVCLVDLDLQFGDVVNYLRLQPNRTLFDACNDYKEDKKNFHIEDYLTPYTFETAGGNEVSFDVIAPPKTIYDAYTIEVAVVEKIIKRLKNFEFVICDLSAVFSALNIAVLDLSTVVNFLGVIDFMPSVKNFKLGYDTLIAFNYPESKIRLVENRSNSQKLISGSDVERVVGAKFYYNFPNDFPSASKSIREGKPLLAVAPDSALTRGIQSLAGMYSNRPQIEIEHVGAPSIFASVVKFVKDLLGIKSLAR